MKLSIIRRDRYQPLPWEIDQLQQAAQSAKLACEVRDIRNINNPELADELGSIVLWRSASVEKFIAKATLFRTLTKKTLINQALARQPYLPFKLYQQQLVQAVQGISIIPTWHFAKRYELAAEISKGRVQFPLIRKPIYGAQGEGVQVLRSDQDVSLLPENITAEMFQPYLPNNGDYRILVLGGVVLGAIKRQAAPGKHVNNLSQGGTAQVVHDEKLLKKFRFIAGQIAALTELHFFGLDLIESGSKLYFLEINTAPQWQGFQQATSIPVATKMIAFCQAMARRDSVELSTVIEDYYFQNLSRLDFKKAFHFCSRLFLWSTHPLAKKFLEDKRSTYLGANDEKIVEKIKTRFAEPLEERISEMRFTEARLPVLKKYPDLLRINDILYFLLFAQTVYGQNLLELCEKIISLKEICSYRSALRNNPQDILILSTHALNYLYLTEPYDQETAPLTPDELFAMINGTASPSLIPNPLRIYFLTHCIINATRFYSQPIPPAQLSLYRQMIQLAEQEILENYHAFSLDVKFEFLVCAKLCQYDTILRKIIDSEASRSLSPLGNFLVDTLNDNHLSLKKNFNSAEHMNALYLMSHTRPV